jgi:hypothetical protein
MELKIWTRENTNLWVGMLQGPVRDIVRDLNVAVL